MEHKEAVVVDVVETADLLQPIYRSTVMPVRKGEYEQSRKLPRALVIALMVFAAACILAVPLIFVLGNPFSSVLNSEPQTAAQVLERAVLEGNPKVIRQLQEYLQSEESTT